MIAALLVSFTAEFADYESTSKTCNSFTAASSKGFIKVKP